MGAMDDGELKRLAVDDGKRLGKSGNEIGEGINTRNQVIHHG